MFQVVVSDLDGTLLGPDSRVDAFTAGALRRVEALGIAFVLATARHHIDAFHIRNTIGIRSHLITINGARAHDPDGERIFAEDLDPAIGRALLSPALAGDRHVSALVDEGWLVNRPCPELDALYVTSGFRARVRDLAAHDGTGLAQVTYMGEKEDLSRLKADLSERFGERVRFASSGSIFLEVLAPAVSKARALAEVLRRLGAPASACVAFGDGQNDIELLAAVGRPFVMKGSSPRLLAALPDAPVAGGNGDAGVARTLLRLLGLPA